MRKINSIVIHCSDSDYAHHDNYYAIRKWHVVERGWSDVGYHAIITKANNGRIIFARPVDRPGAHAKGHNADSFAICLCGGLNFSEEQIKSALALTDLLLRIFNLEVTQVLGHYELDTNKTCPNIDMDEFRERLRERKI